MEFLNDSLSAIGVDAIFEQLVVRTTYGERAKKKLYKDNYCNYQALRDALDILGQFVAKLKTDNDYFNPLQQILSEVLDLTGSLERLQSSLVLTQVELYELKHLLIQIKQIVRRYQDFFKTLPKDLQLQFSKEAYAVLDPALAFEDSFYIDGSFSETLAELRSQIDATDRQIGDHKRQLAQAIMRDYPQIHFRPNGTTVINKDDDGVVALLTDNRLYQVDGHYQYITLGLSEPLSLKTLNQRRQALLIKEEDLLFDIRKALTQALRPHASQLISAMLTIGRLDLYLAKAILAIGVNGTRPNLVQSGQFIDIVEGRHIIVEQQLATKGQPYTAVSITMSSRVTLITGANMGGKTISLKMIGLIVAMAHYGMYVPAVRATIPHYQFMSTIMGDGQSVDKGLSTFGAEMQRLVAVLARVDQAGLILIDELARGTNPSEGWALSSSMINHLSKAIADTVITTHFDGLATSANVTHWQVKGLCHLPVNANYADDTVIARLAEQMDYRLIVTDGRTAVPRDAIKIAKLLGLNTEIVNDALAHLAKDKR